MLFIFSAENGNFKVRTKYKNIKNVSCFVKFDGKLRVIIYTRYSIIKQATGDKM